MTKILKTVRNWGITTAYVSTTVSVMLVSNAGHALAVSAIGVIVT